MQLNVDSLHLTFGERVIFDNATLHLNGPGAHAIIGPSGSGKSSLLAMVAGNLTPDQGKVVFTQSTGSARSPTVSWIVQSSPLLTRRTALDNVMLGPLSRGFDRPTSMKKSIAALSSLGIAGFTRVKVRMLSGGERQRVAVARCMSSSADVILADEPTASLDERARDAVFASILHAKATGAFVLIATHDIVIAQRCDSAHRIQAGKFVQV